MQLRSDIVSRAVAEEIADDLGMQLRDASSNGFVLRPTDAMDEAFRVRGHGDRRVFAVTWSGHYAFMAAIFELDPHAVITSTLAKWNGAKDFYARAEMQQPHNHASPMNWKTS